MVLGVMVILVNLFMVWIMVLYLGIECWIILGNILMIDLLNLKLFILLSVFVYILLCFFIVGF